MSLLVPMTAERACLAFTWRSTIHASVDSPLQVAKQCGTEPGVGARTVCGVDARPVVHGVTDRPNDFVMATWPPPVNAKNGDRCADCSTRLGLGGRQRQGSVHWRGLVDVEEAA